MNLSSGLSAFGRRKFAFDRAERCVAADRWECDMRRIFCAALMTLSLSACVSFDDVVDSAIDSAFGRDDDDDNFAESFPGLVEQGRGGDVDPNLDCAGLASARGSAQNSLDLARYRDSQAGVPRPGQAFTSGETMEMRNEARGQVDAIDRAAERRGC